MKEPIYDVAIAGAGISGLLAAARLGESIPDINIIVVEKEQVLGGRLRTNGGEAGSWSCGLNAVSSELYEFACKSFNLHEDKEDLPSFVNETQSKIGILSGGKIANIDVADVYGRQGARKLGGITAQKSWDKVEDLLFPHDLAHDTASQAMGKAWKHTRKNPAAIVMEHFACSFGVADLWQSTVQAIRERSKAFQQGSITGEWERAFSDLLNREPLKSAISLKTNCHIIEAKRIGDIWKIETEQGTFSTENLIVAQAPWVALDWLAKEYWPVPLLDLTLKTKPVSLVALTSEIEEYVELPDLTYITSEKTIVSVRGKKKFALKHF
ncbi:MAG: NAD(P)-binding protein [Bdellovibrionota bacterium]